MARARPIISPIAKLNTPQKTLVFCGGIVNEYTVRDATRRQKTAMRPPPGQVAEATTVHFIITRDADITRPSAANERS